MAETTRPRASPLLGYSLNTILLTEFSLPSTQCFSAPNRGCYASVTPSVCQYWGHSCWIWKWIMWFWRQYLPLHQRERVFTPSWIKTSKQHSNSFGESLPRTVSERADDSSARNPEVGDKSCLWQRVQNPKQITAEIPQQEWLQSKVFYTNQ